ncbi:MAG TPA: arginine--tRNA ligase [Candidatus Acidoferrum sp.]|nr:arginine--tRNA ligase [Candidatus Acidoferrum sp.]
MNPTTTDAMLPDDALDAFARAIEGIAVRSYPDALPTPVTFEAPRRPEFGDFATNVAFMLAKVARRSPNDVANALIEQLRAESPGVARHFASIDAVAGFINVRLGPPIWQALVAQVLRDGANFGRALPRGECISLEFGSANPTGPLVVVQGRTLSIGDTLARVFRFCGYDVFSEWIINDAGSQMETLGRSLFARYMQQYDPSYPFPEEGYPGDYLIAIAQSIAKRDGEKWRRLPQPPIAQFAQFGRDAIVAEQRATAERFGVRYDRWYSEQADLRDNGRMDEDLAKLRAMGLIYEDAGAQYFKTSQFGDDKDRVIIRSDGSPTYFAPDIAYHYEKLSRSTRAINILGPDHHGYIGRLKAAAAAMGFPGRLDILIAQQITLLRGGEQVSMSKREGNIVTLDEILDEVGVDAARFFFTMLATDSPLTFDLKLAVEQSSDNPVYYVQYGHARIASVLRRADPSDVEGARQAGLSALTHDSEIALARRLSELPRVAQGVVENLAPHRLIKYARDVATEFHQFYTACTILVDERDVRLARLALCIATKSVLAEVLELIGVSAPETM